MRETKESVKLPLPKLEVQKQEVSIFDWKSNEMFVKEYNETLDELEKQLDVPQPEYGNIMGLMSKLRRSTGMMKVLSIAAMVRDFLEDNPQEKITIGVHHTTVREWLMKLLENYGTLSMSGEDDAEKKDEIERLFKGSPLHHVLVANILAAGQGRNLQFCRNAIIAERQWNKKLEEQFIGRFHRIVKNPDGTVKTEFTDADTVNIWIVNAKDTFDEFFDRLVDFKGGVVETADELGEEIPLDVLIQLAREVVQKRIKWVGV
jgi:SNF2 family DNA or RNA helicase